jgi:ribonuclease R
MLSANIAVARKLNKEGIPSLHRNHEKISSEKMVTLSEFLKLHNLSLDRSGNLGVEIQKILEKVKGKFNEQVINLVVLKSMMQAFYSGVPLGHFGLGFKDYTHFTSPIRRYPDLLVHRCLTSIINGTEAPYTFEEIMDIGEKNSEMERVAQEAERDMIKLKSCRFMEGFIGERFSGVVSGVAKFGIFVSLERYPVEGLIPLRLLTDDYYLLEEDMFRITSRKYSKRFTIGDKIEVTLVNVDSDRLRIDFDLAFS